MDLKTVIEQRHSIREFSDEKVDLEDIREIIRLAGLAPSINNYQPWKYYVITSASTLQRMAEEVAKEIANMPEKESRMSRTIKNQAAWYSTFFISAPMLIALAGHPIETNLEKGVSISHDELDKIRNYPDLQSAGASIQNLLLAATDMGYGGCWMTGPLHARKALEDILGISPPWGLLSFVAIGKPKEKSSSVRQKRNLADEIILIK